MLSTIWEQVHVWFLPSRRNDFHPHLLAERGLLLLFALILGAEAFLVSNVVSSQNGAPSLAAVGMGGSAGAAAIQPLPPLLAAAANAWYMRVINPLAQISMRSGAGSTALLVLAVTVAALMGLLAYTLSVRRRNYQTIGYMAGGTMLVFAATFLFFDINYLLPTIASPLISQTVHEAADVNQLAVPAASLEIEKGSAATSTSVGTSVLSTSTKAATITK